MDSIRDAWDMILTQIRAKKVVNESAYLLWFQIMRPHSMDKDAFFVVVPSVFQKNMIVNQFQSLIEDTILEVLGVPLKLNILCEENVKEQIENEDQMTQQIPTGQQFTFDSFIIGNTNEFAARAAKAVADKPALRYNPLYIYGDSGLGKTHLLHAIENEIHAKHPDYKTLYITSEQFLSEMMVHLNSDTMAAFRNKFRNYDVLLVDDIQFLSNKDRTQEEFFHTFDALYQKNKQIVLTSDVEPKNIKTLSDRLISRFVSGLIADVKAPDVETRMLIIKKKAEEMEFSIPDNVASYIAEQLKGNIRQLEGVVKKMRAQYLLIGEQPSISAAKDYIATIRNDVKYAMSTENILAEVSRCTNVTVEDILSRKRTKPICRARQTSIYVIRELTGASYETIGQDLGGLDHSSVLYNYETASDRQKKDGEYGQMIQDIIRNLKSR